MQPLSELISPRAVICGCQPLSRDELLLDLVKIASNAYSWPNGDEIASMVAEREAKMSTGVGFGIAIPHARLENLDRIYVAAACVPDGVDFRAPDRKPVTLAFLLVSPISAAGAHVQVLAAISRIAKFMAERLSQAPTPEQFLAILSEWERDRAK